MEGWMLKEWSDIMWIWMPREIREFISAMP
jgi:hypothetical protein